MPRNGSLTLADATTPTLRVTCAKCPRRGEYSVRRLWETRGDIMLTYFLAEISADCPRRKRADFTDWCAIRMAEAIDR